LRSRAFVGCADRTAVALGSGLKKQKIGRQQQGAVLHSLENLVFRGHLRRVSAARFLAATLPQIHNE
jgi:hypothetical protein